MRSSKTTTLLLAAVAGSALLGLGASPVLAQAVDFDAGRDMLANEVPNDPTDAVNPNVTVPQWSYGYRATAGGTALTLFPATDHTDGTGPGSQIQGFADQTPGGCCGPLPLLGVNTGGAVGDPQGSIATGEMLLHPDGNAAGNFADEQKAVVRFTATTAGDYAVTALFEDVNECCTGPSQGVDVHVVRDGTAVFDSAVSREGGDALPDATAYAGTLTLGVGSTVDFVVGTNGQLFGDSTRFNATLDLIPEPGVLGLLGVGGLLALRRGRRAARA